MRLLELSHAEELFDGLGVIEDISLSVGEREVVSVVGPSGSGKSTLLRCATVLETMDSGEVIYLGKWMAWMEDGRAVHASKKDLREIQSQYGLMSRNLSLFPHYSVMKGTMDAPIHVQRRDKAQVHKETRILLEKMGLEDKKNAYPYQLFGSQCQRVTIARALALSPRIPFFDELASALDPELIGEVPRVTKSLVDLDIAVVIVTHEMAFAKDISNRVAFMAGSAVVEEGTPEQVFASDNERIQSFLGRYGALPDQS